MKTILIAAFLCTLASTSALHAQVQARSSQPAAGTGEIRGKVLDGEAKTPVASASVAVWTKESPTLVAGALTRQDGSFRIEGLLPGAYTVKITMIGYDTHSTGELVIAPSAPRAAIGDVALAKSPIKLTGVEVNAERAVIIAPDRNVYRARDIAPAAANATEVLSATPSVQVDPDGKVSLRGNENVVVQINGRPVPIRGQALTGYLKQLPGSTIERIEVIPNPSAKYDPEGMAGILNIVMKQGVDLGRSVGLSLTGSTNAMYNGSANFGYQSGPLSLLISYGYNSMEQRIAGSNDRTRLNGQRAAVGYTEQDIAGVNANQGHNLNTTVDYRIGQRDVLFTSVLANRRTLRDQSLTAYDELNGSRVLLAQYDRTREQNNLNWMVDAAVGLRHSVTPQKNELTTELRFSRQADDERNALARHLGSASPLELQNDALDAGMSQLTAQLDYVRAFGKGSKLESGVKGSARWMDRDFLVRKDALGNGDWIASDLSNTIGLDETVSAAYAVVSQARGKLELQAGLRAEVATRDFTVGGVRYPHDYGSLFPSALASYKLNDKAQARLSYSRRIRRPNTQELNPFPAFFDVNNVFMGNPELNPEYTHALEAGLQRSGAYGSVQVAPFYRYTTNIIGVDINTADTLANREVTTISFKNLAHRSSWGSDFNGQLRLGKFSALTGFSIFRVVTDGGSESALSNSGVTWQGRFNGSYTLTPTTTVQAMYNYRAPTTLERGRFHAQHGANFAVRQKLSQQATAMLRVNDPFKTTRFRVEVGNDDVFQLTDRSFNSRGVFLGLQYNVGQAPRIKQRQEEQQQGGGFIR